MQGIILKYIPIVIVLLIALTFHEFAHAWVAYRLGDDTAYRQGRVSLNPIVHLDIWGSLCFFLAGFGWAKPVPVMPTNFSNPRRDDFLVSGAGPLSNVFLAIVSSALLRVFQDAGFFSNLSMNPTIELVFIVLHLMIYCNLMLAFFNLIPLTPLDGSHMVTSLLPLEQAYHFKKFNQEYGPWVLLLLVMIGPMTNGAVAPMRWLLMRPVFLLYGLITPSPVNIAQFF